MSFEYSARQKTAFTAKGDSLLVSAAAGSGKTAVLVERVLKYLMEEKGDIRRLLITTYTEAAAAEMRLKIKKRVDAALQENPSDHLMRQSALIESAQIGTTHSVCLQLITRFFDQLKMDPRMRLMDQADERELKQELAEELLEELYASEEERVRHLLECYAPGRSDDNLLKHLIRGADFLEEQPLPDKYIERALAPYRSAAPNIFDRFAGDGLYLYFKDKLDKLQLRLPFVFQKLEELLLADEDIRAEARAKFTEQENDFETFLRLVSHRDYDAISRYVRDALDKKAKPFVQIEWKRWFGLDGAERKKEEKDWNAWKNALKEVWSEFELTEEEQLARMEEQGERLECYFDLCSVLRKRILATRRGRGYITYGDMERLAVELLVEDYDLATDRLVPTPTALKLREDYDEIIVDEFQDANRNQDLIFRALSRDGKNLFMVGDMKQSIYRFRGAEPEIFDQKRKAARSLEPRPEERDLMNLKAPAVLELNANYRSHPGVLEFANNVFEAIMSEQVGGVDYDSRERLYPERDYAEKEAVRAEIHWLLRQKTDAEGKPISVAQQNAAYAADLIQKMVAEEEPLLMPDGEIRPAEYKDFCILLHTTAGAGKYYEKELQKRGIGVMNRNEEVQFFDLPEVQSLLSYLLVLDNPYNDVALVSLLLGDYFRFTVAQIADLRHRKAPLYDDLRAAAQTEPAAKAAYETIEGYRSLAGTLYVYDLLHRILQESGVMAAYAAKGETEKCANLELLAEDARVFEKEGYRGLYAFIQHIRIVKGEPQGGARLQSEENSVKIMTIHKSKGLEFPVCILGDPQGSFSRKDTEKKILLHPRYGAAVETIEPISFYQGESLSRNVLVDQMAADMISEQERLLYVALTRPQSKTIILANEKEEVLERCIREGAVLERPLPRWLLTEKSTTYDRWLLTLLGGAAEGAPLRAKFSIPEKEYAPLLAEYKDAALMASAPKPAEPAAKKKGISFESKEFLARMDWRYPHLSAVGMPAKLSVSELKGLRQPEEDAATLQLVDFRPVPPRFLGKARGNERGNALHQALQFADFEALQKDVGAELDRLVALQFITAEQRKLIEEQKIRTFTQSDCFKALLAAEEYHKEERFLFPLSAEEIFGAGEEEILIQGVLDCYSVTDGEAIVLDYKTDQVSDPAELIARYQGQMDLYEQALRRVKGLRVTAKIIYSFALDQAINL